MNRHLLVSDVHNFAVEYQINPYMRLGDQPDQTAAQTEHQTIVEAHRSLGRKIEHIPSAPGCPDMVYTANAALVRGDIAIMGNLPQERRHEQPHFRAWLTNNGFDVIDAPYPFGGQGDALPCGNLLLAGYDQRTDRRMHSFLARQLDYEVVPLRTADQRWYDIDLAVAVVQPPHTIAYYPEALDPMSRRTIRSLGLDLIRVMAGEAKQFALNLISDGCAVTMTQDAPNLAAELRGRGLHVLELATTQLRKGGGGVRCTSLTLDNPEPSTTPPVHDAWISGRRESGASVAAPT